MVSSHISWLLDGLYPLNILGSCGCCQGIENDPFYVRGNVLVVRDCVSIVWDTCGLDQENVDVTVVWREIHDAWEKNHGGHVYHEQCRKEVTHSGAVGPHDPGVAG